MNGTRNLVKQNMTDSQRQIPCVCDVSIKGNKYSEEVGKEEKKAMEYMRRKSRIRHYCGAGPTIKIHGCGGE